LKKTGDLRNINYLQFEEGGPIPLPILRRIEELYEQDQAKLDTAFNGYDKCSSKGRKIFNSNVFSTNNPVSFGG